ncbi:TetR/AcrR family transcriptional regulator [Archangium primigenium]|uniref:TetR/AcrR family transcriptional regulator n=1 Tax=[Archangium] primigenium TaxID=2792470 RepID=UPI00195684D1|nr:TetR/AcrR family transcriptional regulator [Archangium primigenium]
MGPRAPGTTAPEDPRVLRSRALLRDALLALIRERGFDAIHVRDLTARARLNRSTFYLHYRDKDDLLTHVMRDMLLELSRGHQRLEASHERLHQTLRGWFEHAAAHAELYQLMLGQRSLHAYSLQLRGILERLMNAELKDAAELPDRLKGVPLPVMSRFMASAYLGVLEWWLDRRAPHPPEDMARWLATLSSLLDSPVDVPRDDTRGG